VPSGAICLQRSADTWVVSIPIYAYAWTSLDRRMSERIRSGDQSLREFLTASRTVRSVPELLSIVMDLARPLVGATVCGFSLVNMDGVDVCQVGAPDALISEYRAFTAAWPDPVHAALATRGGVVRSSDVFDDDAWRAHRFCRELVAPFGLDAYMAGEVLDTRGARGVIGVSRTRGCRAFQIVEALRLQTLCHYTSVALVRLAEEELHSLMERLSEKQQRLVQLVAHGLTNVQIGRECGVSIHAVKKMLERLFDKMNVSSRAELVARVGVGANRT
jgi:DNA-binding CsgD family transcriptional regulator